MALLLLLPSVHAIAIGVNRASVNFDDVLRGGYAETVITVTTDSPELVSAEVLMEGEASAWITFSSREFNFSRDKPYQLHVIAQPPLDTRIASYQVNLSVITGSLGYNGDGRMGTSTRASFRIPLNIQMTGTERVACTVGGVNVFDTEVGDPLQVEVSVLNRGNVRVNPRVDIEIFDRLRAESLGTNTQLLGVSILPTLTEQRSRLYEFDLDPNQYWAQISVPECGYSNLLTFDVLEPGGIKDDGDFIRIEAPAWAETGDIIEINAVFRNRGPRAVRASFKGTISSVETGEIVKVIDTDEYIVDPDITAELETFFNPLIGGQYRVNGKVYYNSKLTAERETIINVNGSPIEKRMTSTTLIIMVMVIVILALMIMIKRRRQG